MSFRSLQITRRVARVFPWLVVVILGLSIFGTNDTRGSAPVNATLVRFADPAPVTTSMRTERAPAAPPAPPGLRAAYIATRQAEGARDPGYAFHVQGGGATFSARAMSGLAAEVGRNGVAWRSHDPAWHADLTGKRYGCAGSLTALDRTSVPRMGASPNRVALEERAGRASLEEWYVNGPLGLDQGWTLRDRPCADGDAELEVSVRGLAAARRGDGVDLRDPSGTTRLHYSDLSARDADGKVLASSMDVVDGQIVLRIETTAARFPVVVDPLQWATPQLLTNSSLPSAAEFGGAIAVSGNTAVIGASNVAGSDGTPSVGVAYVYTLSSGAWTLKQTISAPNPTNMGDFGIQVALSSNVLAIGSFGGSFSGAVYVYGLSGGVWTLSPSSPLTVPGGPIQGDGFGANGAIAISGTTLFVGSTNLNAVYEYAQSGTAWTYLQSITTSDSSAGAFGSSIAVSGNTVIVGAPNSTVNSVEFAGAAYAFTFSGSSSAQIGKLVPPAVDLGTNSEIIAGSSIAISGTTIFVSAQSAPVGSADGVGAVYLYTQSGTTFSGPTKLVSTDGTPGFGGFVAMAGPNLIVSGPSRIYVFTGSGTNWTQQLAIGEPDGQTVNGFGFPLAASGANLLVSADCYMDDTIRDQCGPGAVFAGLLAATNGSSCSASSDCQSVFCVSSVCCATACTDPCTAGCSTGTCVTASAGTSCGSSGYVCNGSVTTCPTSCTSDSGCVSGDYCAANQTCQPRKGQGAACNVAAGADCLGSGCRECASGGCVDGVCCSTTSCGNCEACATALQATGGTNGVCSNAPLGSDPHSNCGSTSTCNGAGACGLKTGQSTTSAGACATGFDVDGVCCGTSCSGACQVCSTALGAPANGTCGAALAGSAGNPACGSGIACNGTSGSCPGTSCTADSGCVAGFYCGSGGSCQPQKAQGVSCNVAAGGDCEGSGCRECGGGTSCVDNVCCGSATCPACDACSTALQAPGGTNGTCSPSAKNTDPHGSCSTTSTCNGTGACGLKNGQASASATACASGIVANGVCCGTSCTAACDVCTAALGSSADGTCGAAKAGSAGSPSCTPYVCGGSSTTCPTSCSTDSNCVSGFYCGADGACHAQKAQGGTCNLGTSSSTGDCAVLGCRECSTNNCVDGVCCGTAGCGTCQACGAALQAPGGTNGSCSPALANSDPHSNCPATSTCNGTGACGLKNGQASAVANTCASGFSVDGVCCGSACSAACEQCTAVGSTPAGTCAPSPSGSPGSPSCGTVVCNGTATSCPGAACTSDASCAAGFYCGSGGTCQPQRTQGSACNATAGASGDCLTAGCQECAGSGSCVDNVCCGSSSCPSCESCSAALQAPGGTAGTCGPSLAGTDPHSNCMSGSTCNGSGACELENGQPSTSASACASGNLADGVCCDLPCAGSCTACTVAHGASKDGSCTTLPDGTACAGGTCEATMCQAPEDAGIADAEATITDGSVSADASEAKVADAAVSSDAATKASTSDAAIAEAGGGSVQSTGDASDQFFARKTPNCSCRVTGSSTPKTPALAGLLAVAAALARRGRRKSARRSGQDAERRGPQAAAAE
ncbi:MAG TPA: FG-GAP repeat protein [Polyangiaceae bacterium]|nr:FG-GAP repeat protein [Polyangiaceae bacterium]